MSIIFHNFVLQKKHHINTKTTKKNDPKRTIQRRTPTLH